MSSKPKKVVIKKKIILSETETEINTDSTIEFKNTKEKGDVYEKYIKMAKKILNYGF